MLKQQEEQVEYYKKQHAYINVLESPYSRQMASKAIQLGKIRKDANILEFGCGAGRFTITFLKWGYKVTGLDISPELLGRLKKNLGSMKAKLVCQDIKKFAKKNKEKFDYVVGFHVLHHIEDLEETFKEMNKVLKPGGQIIFLEPNPYGPLFYLQIVFEKDISWKGEKNILGTFPSKMRRAIGKAGFRNTSIRKFGHFPPAMLRIPGTRTADRVLEKIFFWNPLLIFQSITARKP